MDLNGFREGADLQCDRYFDGLSEAYLHIGPINRVESLEFRMHGIRAGRQKRNSEPSFRVAYDRFRAL